MQRRQSKQTTDCMAYLNRDTIPTSGFLRAFQLTVIVEECALRSTAWVLDVTHVWRTQVT